MLIVAVTDILVELRWLDSKANGLADVFLRFNEKYLAKICLFWQNLFAKLLHPQLNSTTSQEAILFSA